MNDLLGMLNALNIYNSQDQVLLLDANTVQKIYSDFVPRILSKHEQAKYKLEHKIPEDSIERPFCKLFLMCLLMFQKLHIQHFYYSDLIDPEPKKTRYFLTELSKYAMWVAEQQEQLQSYFEKHQQALQAVKDAEATLQLTNQQLVAEKQLKLQLREQEAEKLMLLQELEKQAAKSRQMTENLNQVFQEEQDKLGEKQQQHGILSQNIYMLYERKKKLQSQLVSNPNSIEEQFTESLNSLDQYQRDKQTEIKLKSLLEFKAQVFTKLLKKIAKLMDVVTQLKSTYMNQLDGKEQLHSSMKQIKTMEHQIRQITEQCTSMRDLLALKSDSFLRKQRDFDEICQQQSEMLHKIELDSQGLREYTQSVHVRFEDVMSTKSDLEQSIQSLTQQTLEIYANAKSRVQDTLHAIINYEHRISELLHTNL